MSIKHWWEQFCEENSQNIKINKITQSLNAVENKLNEDEMHRIRKEINDLDPEVFEEEIHKLNQRYSIIKNRMERQISDDFGVLLKHLRKKKGYSLARLGEISGISPSYINRLELNQRKSPSINIIKNLADSLDVPLSILTKAAGVNLDSNKIYQLTDLIYLNKISLKPNGPTLLDEQKEKLISILEIITTKNYNETTEKKLLEEVKLFRNLL